MKALKSSTQLLSEARQFEDAGRLTEAADVYQQLVDADPTHQQAVSRLLTLYRRLKEPKKELAVIESVLAAYAQKDKASQQKWLSAHPQAASASRAFLRSLGTTTASGFGANPLVGRLLKRKEVVGKKLHGKSRGKAKAKPKSKVKEAGRQATPAAAKKTATAAERKTAEKQKRAEERRLAAEEKKQAAEARRLEAQQKKAEAAATRKAEAAAKKNAGLAAKQAAIPSLFVISLRYLAPLEKIDALLPKHTAFLDKHFASGDFLVAGRQIPRTGGIIIARGKDRASIERIMKQDPFTKTKLASVDIVEFAAARLNKKQWQQMP